MEIPSVRRHVLILDASDITTNQLRSRSSTPKALARWVPSADFAELAFAGGAPADLAAPQRTVGEGGSLLDGAVRGKGSHTRNHKSGISFGNATEMSLDISSNNPLDK